MMNIQQYNVKCRDVTTVIKDVWTKEWQDKEKKFQNKLLQQSQQAEEKCHIRILYLNYKTDKNVN